VRSELRVVVRRVRFDGLDRVPMLNDPPRTIEPEDIHRGVAEIIGPRGDVRVRHHEIALLADLD
jgi:hypothetical protein